MNENKWGDNMNNKFCKGSEWRKWDLHVHTPASVLNNQFGNDWDLYVKKLFNSAITNNVHVIGITDYFSIEGYKKIVTKYINNDKKLLKLFSEEISADKNYINKIKSIRLLPNIEFRFDKIVASKKDGKKPRKLNYHIIFSDDLDITEIEENFLEDIEFSYQANPKLGFENRKLKKHNLEALGKKLCSEHEAFKGKSDYYIGCMNAAVNPENICNILFKERPHLFKNKFVLVLAEECFDLISWDSQDHQTKKNILSVSNMIFSSNDKTRQWALSPEFAEEFGGNKPCIWGSDAHSFEELFNPSEDKYCWIKTDTTFEGLLQVLNEPKDRVYIGREPNKLKTINLNKSRYIHKLRIEKEEDYCLSEEWFDTSIEFNNGLVAIIGNKGSGKSALADIIGLLGNSRNEVYFSFLNTERFRKKPENLAKYFKATLTWLDGYVDSKNLSENVDESQVEKIKYLPQTFIENICNDLSNRFQDEINEMVFSYLPEHEKLDRRTFDDLMSYLCSDIDNKIQLYKNNLANINKKIIKLENKQIPKYIDSIKNNIENLHIEIENHIKAKPVEVVQPLDEEEKNIANEIEILEERISEINNAIMSTQDNLKKINIQIADLIKVKNKINELNQEYQNVIEEIGEVFSKYNLHIDIKLNLQYSLKELEETISQLNIQKEENQKLLEDDIDKRTDISLYEKKDKLVIEKEHLISEMDKANRDYQNYLENLKEWDTRLKELIGDENQEGTLKYYKSEYEYIQSKLPEEIKQLYKEREDISRKIYNLKRDKMKIYEKVYMPVMERINKINKAQQDNETQQDNIQFSVDIFPSEDFSNKLLSMINQTVSSRFRGIAKGNTELKEMVEKYDFNHEQESIDCIIEIYDELTKDKSNIDKLIKNREEVYNYLFSLDYLEIKYRLKLDGKNMEKLSPGERGILLLIFYLVLDKDNSPLIIDQPEDNLDNQSVYKKLVPFIREAKNRRQVIIVTHNPNIAVACDAEQIICCNMNKDNYSIEYVTGSIENPRINEKIVDILEGTMPAFTHRKLKYKFGKEV